MAYESNDPAWLEYQRQMDDQNLNTLVILHRIWGGIGAFAACLIGLLVVGVLSFIDSAASTSSRPPPDFVKVIFGSFYGFASLLIAVCAILNFLCANWLRDRRNWVGVIIVSALNCLSIPLGLGLAVFTLIVVNRPEVRSRFQS